MLNSVLKRHLDYWIKSYRHKIEQKIEEAQSELKAADDYKKENPGDWFMTNALSEPGDGTARINNAELNIRLAKETIDLGEDLENTFDVLGKSEDPRLLPNLHNKVKQHLTKLESESEKIPEESRWNGARTNDLNDIKRFWIKAKIDMVKKLLKSFPDGAEFGTELQEFKSSTTNGGRRHKRTGKKCSRSGTTRTRRGCTRRRLRRRQC